jgi:Pvc16 N-terminal domain
MTVADFRAITGVCDAVIRLLRLNYKAGDFNNELQFQIYLADNFSDPMASGVSFFLYRVVPNGTHRTPRGRIGPGQARYRTQLPVDLHFLLTAWGKDASLQHRIVGWMMRTMEDNPILPVGLLNAGIPDTFKPDEMVEIGLAELTNEEMFRLWEIMVQNSYQISIPYTARMVMIESTQTNPEDGPVQERSFDYREHGEPAP